MGKGAEKEGGDGKQAANRSTITNRFVVRTNIANDTHSH